MSPTRPTSPMRPHGNPLFSGAGAGWVVVSTAVVFTSVVAVGTAAGAAATLPPAFMSVVVVAVVAAVLVVLVGAPQSRRARPRVRVRLSLECACFLLLLKQYGWARSGRVGCSIKSGAASTPFSNPNREERQEDTQTPGSTSDPGTLRDDCSSAP